MDVKTFPLTNYRLSSLMVTIRDSQTPIIFILTNGLLLGDRSLPGQRNIALQATQHEEFSPEGYLDLDGVAFPPLLSLFQEARHFHRTQTASQELPGQVATDGSVPAVSVYTRNMMAKVIAEEIYPGQHH